MKGFKKIVSLGVALSVILSMFVCSYRVSAENVTVETADLEVLEKLTALDVVDAVSENELKEYLTREDMVPILVKYLRFDSAVDTHATSPFLDVDPNTKNIGEYRLLYDTGYILGDENKMYRPHDLLTYNEAVTMIVNAMGYKELAIRNGGYPTGYLYTANKWNLLEGLRENGTSPIPYCDLYRLINASIHANAVVSRVFDGNSDAEFTLQKDVTVLEELYNIKITQGIVTGTENTRLLTASSHKIDRNQLEIEGILFDTPGKEYAHLLGRNVYAYYKESSAQEYSVVYIEDSKKNQEFKLDVKDVLVDKTTDDTIYYNDENDKTKKINTNGTTTYVIKNGKRLQKTIEEVFAKPLNGYIVGLDNSGDEVVDVLFVYSYENLYVGTINPETFTYYDRIDDGKSVVLDPEVDDVRAYNKDGKQVLSSTISAGNVISIMESEGNADYKIKTVYISNEVVEGKVTEITDEKYKINDTYYKLANNLEAYINAGLLPEISIGTDVVFHLDYFGDIAYAEKSTATNATYGFVAGVDSEKTVSNRISLKIYNQNSAWIEADLADKVKIDEVLYNVASDADCKKILENVVPNEIVLYKLSDGKISMIDTARGGGNLTIISQTNGTLEWRNNLAFTNYNDTSEGKFVAKNGEFIVFCVPEEAELLTKTNHYSILTSINEYTNLRNVTAYNLGEKEINAATCILAKGNVGSTGSIIVSRSTPLSVVLKTTQAVDAEGAVRAKLHYSTNGVEEGATVADELGYITSWSGSDGNDLSAGRTATTLDALDLKPGDVIQVGKNAEGNIADINVIYRADQTATNAGDAYFTDDTFLSNIVLAQGSPYGLVMAYFDCYDESNGFIKFYLPDGAGGQKEYYIHGEAAGINVYNSVTKKSKAVSLENLIKGDKIVIKTDVGYASQAHQIIALR